MEKKIFKLTGHTSILEVYEDHCAIIAQKSALSFVAGRILDGTKEYYYSDLTSIQYKVANSFINGYIQFEYPGSHSGQNNFTSENSFVINKRKTDLEQCEKAVAYIKNRIKEAKQNKNGVVQQALSPADELKKFKDLLDSGVITQSEFEEKKKQVLGI